jgi:hypothetical protein
MPTHLSDLILSAAMRMARLGASTLGRATTVTATPSTRLDDRQVHAD